MADSRLMLAGVTPGVRRRLDDIRLTRPHGGDAAFMAQPRVGLSVREAVAHAQEWIAAGSEQHPPPAS